MGIFDKLKAFFKNDNKQTFNSRATHWADGFYGEDSFTNVLTTDEMLSLSYITKSIQMIAHDCSKVKWIQKKTQNNRSFFVTNSRLYWMLNRKPSNDLNGYNFKSILVWNLFLYSKAIIYCHYEKINGKYYLTELLPLYPEYVSKEYNKNNELYYKVYITENESLNVPKEQIIWIDYAVLNNVNNVSLKALFKSTFAKLKENEKALINSIKNDTGVSMLVNVPDITDQKSVSEVQNAINEMVKNQKKYGSIAMVKDRRWTIEPNTNIIESKIDYTTRNAIAREVSAIFGIPASKLGIEDNNKYNTLIERNRAYVDNAVKPILDIITMALTDYFFESDMTNEITYRAVDLLSLDPGALKDFATSAINNAFATPNEIRELIGWEALKEGDILLANSAIVPVQDIITKSKIELSLLKEQKNASNKPNESNQTNDTQEQEEPVKSDLNEKNEQGKELE